MKKIIIISLLASVIGFTSCDPVEKDYSTNQSYITADELKAASAVTVYQENGQNINYVHFTSTAGAPLHWSNGALTQAVATGDMIMLVTGEQSMTVTALNPDGTTVSASFPVNIQKISADHPVAAEWGELCGTGSKSWTWDDQTGRVWGNMGYLSATGGIAGVLTDGGWWGETADGISKQAASYKYGLDDSGSNATMTFSLNGSSLTKSSGGVGTFAFDMSKTKNNADGTKWSIGQLTTTGDGVLFPVQINTGNKVNTLEIRYLDDKYMVLTYASDGTGAWGEATYWHFKAK